MLFQHRFGKPIISMHEAISDLSLDLVSRVTKFRFKKMLAKAEDFFLCELGFCQFLSVIAKQTIMLNDDSFAHIFA